jgi:ribonuclease Y
VNPVIYIIATGIVVAIGLFAGFIITKNKSGEIVKSAQDEAGKIRQDAEKNAESKKKEAILEAKEEMHKLRNDFEKESKDRRNEIQRLERRLLQREESIDKKSDMLEKREENLNKKQLQIEETVASVEELYVKQREELQRLSGLSSEEAKQLLLDEINKEIKHEAAILIKDVEARAKEEADKKAREIITCAIQRCAADHVA